MVSEKEAQEAVKVLLGYIEGEEHVGREGLLDTPKRVVESWNEIFAGYNMDASELLQATFNAEGYDGIVLLRNIEFTSTCGGSLWNSAQEAMHVTVAHKRLLQRNIGG